MVHTAYILMLILLYISHHSSLVSVCVQNLRVPMGSVLQWIKSVITLPIVRMEAMRDHSAVSYTWL